MEIYLGMATLSMLGARSRPLARGVLVARSNARSSPVLVLQALQPRRNVLDALMQRFAANLPGYCADWLGGYRGIELHQMKRGVWLFSGVDRALLVTGRTTADARAAVRKFVSEVEPQTDRRRTHWFWT